MRLSRSTAVVFALAAVASTAAAQRAASCSRNQAVADLGYDGIDCTNCNISRDYMEFLAEPTISQVRRNGPADGKLRDGDVLVAVDGRLITTRSAWRYLANLRPDDPVRLTIRRNGVERDVSIVPDARCRDERYADQDASFTVRGGAIVMTPPGGGAATARASRDSDADADRSRDRDRDRDMDRRGADVTVFPPDPTPPSRARIATPDGPVRGRGFGRLSNSGVVVAGGVRPSSPAMGWIGIGLECDACRASSAGGESRWTFQEEPVLAEVVRGGPAWRAGLRPGDRLMSIDGHSITSPEGGRRWGNFRPSQEVALTIRRGTSMRTFSFEAEDRPGTNAVAAMPAPDTEMPSRLDLPDNRPAFPELRTNFPDNRPDLPDNRAPSSDRQPVRMSYDVGGSLVSVEGGRAETYFDRRTGELVIVGPDFTVRVKPKP